MVIVTTTCIFSILSWKTMIVAIGSDKDWLEVDWLTTLI